MKVFISHASPDKWAARRISQEIQALGAQTFLDEKDIETGESIDDAIAKHLKDSDEVLILLSPASVKSHWVLVEVGGARALQKRLVPILLYLGVNEIPSPITKHLARDINAIEQYYAELKSRIAGLAPKLPSPTPFVRRRRRLVEGLSVGDRVRLPLAAQDDVLREIDGSAEMMRLLDWDKDMNKYLGQEATVLLVDTDRSVHLDIDGEKNWWAFEWLTKIHSSEA